MQKKILRRKEIITKKKNELKTGFLVYFKVKILFDMLPNTVQTQPQIHEFCVGDSAIWLCRMLFVKGSLTHTNHE